MPALVPATVISKATIRLVPFLGLLYFVSFLDRVNVGYAALTMNADIGLSASAFGLGAGIFFVGYFVFEVPGNLGGYLGPFAIGWLKDVTGGYTAGLLVLTAAMAVSGLVVLYVGNDS